MAKIPFYEDKLLPQGMLNVRANAPEVSAAAGTAMHNFGAAGQQLAAVELQLEREKNNDNAAQSAGTAIMEYTKQNMEFFDEERKASLADPSKAAGFTNRMMEGFKKGREQLLAGITNDHARKYAITALNQTELHFFNQARQFENAAGQAFADIQLDKSLSSAAEVVGKNPELYDFVRDGIERQIANGYTDPAHMAGKAISSTHALSSVALNTEMKRNPRGTYNALQRYMGIGGEGTRKQAIDFVLSHEGSAYVGADSNGAPVKYGINQQYYPGEDIKGMTAARATEIYTKDYWNKINGDELAKTNPALATAVMDTAVLSGVGKAQKLLDQSGGDVNRFLDLRQQFLDGLATSNAAKYGRYQKAWTNRTNDLRAIASGSTENGPMPDYMTSILRGVDATHLPSFLDHAKVAVHQADALDLANFQDAMKDSKARADNGIPDAQPKPMTEFVRLLGPEKGPIAYREYQDTQEYAGQVAKLKTASPAEYQQILDEMKLGNDPQAPGYAGDQARLKRVQGAWDAVQKMRNDDPAGYVYKNSNTVQQAWQAWSSAPPDKQAAAAQAFATASLAEQQRLGIISPRLLTDSMKKSMLAEYAKQEDGGAGSAQLLQQWGQQWGKNWGRVYNELAPDLSPVARVMATMGSEMSPATQALIVSTAKMKPDDLKTAIPSDKSKSIDDKLTELFADFSGSVAYQPGGLRDADSIKDATRKLAYVYAARGESAGDSASMAYNNVIGKNYDFIGKARIPKGYDLGAIGRATENAMNLLDSYDLMLPPTPPGMTDKMAKTQYIDALKFGNQSAWITAGDGSGLTLYDTVSGTPVRMKDGRDLKFTWDELLRNGGPSVWQKMLGQEVKRPGGNEPAPPAGTPSITTKDTGNWNK